MLDEKYVPDLLNQIPCVVVQASYRSALTDKAAVVLPAAIWCEKSAPSPTWKDANCPAAVLPVSGEAREDAAILESVFA